MAEVDLSMWNSDYVQYNDNRWKISEDTSGSGNSINFIYGPYMKLVKGTYTVNITYKCESNQTMIPFTTNGNQSYIKTGNAILSKNSTNVSYDFEILNTVDNFEVVVHYSGIGDFEIYDISIEKNHRDLYKFLTIYILICVLLHISLLYKVQIIKNRNMLLLLLLMVVFSSFPVFMYGINLGHDIPFHLIRIDGIANELRKLNIPVRIQSLWMDGYGYPVSIYYGDIFLYISALFRILGFSVMESYKIYIVVVNLLTVIVSYYSFYKMSNCKQIAMATTFIYTFSTYRLVNIYIRAAVGESTAQIFLPLVALAVYLIYSEKTKCNIKRNSIILSIGMSAIICTHMLTAEMVCVVLLIICVVLCKKTFEKNVFLTLVVSILQVVVISAYFIVPFLDYYANVSVKINEIIEKGVPCIQSFGAYLLQYFSFFQNPFGAMPVQAKDRMALTPGIASMLVLIWVIYLWINNKANKEIKFLAGLGIFVLVFASDVFPWNFLALKFDFFRFLTQVQFPFRYIGIATIVISVLFVVVMKLLKSNDEIDNAINISKLITVTSMFSMFLFMGQYRDGSNLFSVTDIEEIDMYGGICQGEYIRTGTDTNIYNMSIEPESENVEARVVEVTDSYVVNCVTKDHVGTLEIPIFNYKGYVARDSFGNKFEINDGQNNKIKITIPSNYTGDISVRFEEPVYWRIAEVVSVISVSIIIVYIFYRKKMM